jgi:hypothetical protein
MNVTHFARPDRFMRTFGPLALLLLAYAVGAVAFAQVPRAPTLLLDSDTSLQPAMTVEYIDPNGVRQNVAVVNGQTTITGIAPLLVEFDASFTRAQAAFSGQSAIPDPAAYAYLMVGYRINFGEGLGTTYRWPTGLNYSRDEEMGPPLFSRVFTNPGTRSVRLRVRDVLGNEATIGLTVVVRAPSSTVNIPTSAGRWPTWASGTRYTLSAGGDYRGFGALEFQNHHNISVEKTGTGADPRISSFRPDSRLPTPGTQFDTRSRHIRLVGLDIGHMTDGLRGHEYVGVIGGTLRRWTGAPLQYDWERTDNTGRSNIRYPRGVFLQSIELRNEGADNGYVYIGTLRGFHMRDTLVRYDGTQGGNAGTHLMLRLYGTQMSIRNNLYFAAAPPSPASNCGTVTSFLSLPGPTDDVWRDDDLMGPIGSANPINLYGYFGSSQFMQRNQIYDSGSFVCNAIASNGGNPFEHASPSARVRPRLVGYEDNVFGNVSRIALASEVIESRGRWGFSRNNRRSLGAGAFVDASTGSPNWASNDSTTFNGPYLIETTNSRPVPSTF